MSETPQAVWWDGAWLRTVRQARNMSAVELAERAGCSVSAVQDIEGNRIASPGIIVLRRIASALEVPLSRILSDPDPDSGSEFREGYQAAMLDMQDALFHLRRNHGAGSG